MPKSPKKLASRQTPTPEMTDTEAAEYWATHEVDASLVEAGRHDPEVQAFAQRLAPRSGPRTPRTAKGVKPTSIRLDADLEERLRVVAARKQIPYQTMLKDFVRERLYEEEKRLKIV
ncbi:hypothetical protein [Deinococcus pimensis]|uniref:hypothetical protein n=1 Tax=Deinococcus pimensis TaxID=309888 RepID=UPI0004AE24F9|nr:hypothetical protein [Deinococcus pimensis]